MVSDRNAPMVCKIALFFDQGLLTVTTFGGIEQAANVAGNFAGVRNFL